MNTNTGIIDKIQSSDAARIIGAGLGVLALASGALFVKSQHDTARFNGEVQRWLDVNNISTDQTPKVFGIGSFVLKLPNCEGVVVQTEEGKPAIEVRSTPNSNGLSNATFGDVLMSNPDDTLGEIRRYTWDQCMYVIDGGKSVDTPSGYTEQAMATLRQFTEDGHKINADGSMNVTLNDQNLILYPQNNRASSFWVIKPILCEVNCKPTSLPQFEIIGTIPATTVLEAIRENNA